MIINNQKQAVNLRIQKSLALLAVVMLLGLIYFANVIPHIFMGLTRNQIGVSIIALFLLYFAFHYLRNHNYIYFSDAGSKLILRWFSLRPFEGKKNSIEFNKDEFHTYEVKRSFLGLNSSIIIYRKTPRGLAKYPPVSITTLNGKDSEKMINSLQRLKMANQAGR